MPRLVTRRVKHKDACLALGCSARTFARKWRDVFTDLRPKADRRPGCERQVLEDELSIAVEYGAAAVATFRLTMKRR